MPKSIRKQVFFLLKTKGLTIVLWSSFHFRFVNQSAPIYRKRGQLSVSCLSPYLGKCEQKVKTTTSTKIAEFPLKLCLLLFCVLQKQLFGIEAPVQLTGWRKHLNSYTLQGRRNVCETLNLNVCTGLIKGSLPIHTCVTVCSLTVCVSHLWDVCCSSCCLLDAQTEQKREIHDRPRRLSSHWQCSDNVP